MGYGNRNKANTFLEENEAREETVFMDKYRLSFNILEQEGILIQQYNQILRSIKAGYFNTKTIMESHDFLDCWTILKGLYDFLEFSKLNNWSDDKKPKDKKKEKKFVEIQKDRDKLKSLVADYNDDKSFSFANLNEAYNILRKFIALSGYHEDTYKEKGGGLGDEED